MMLGLVNHLVDLLRKLRCILALVLYTIKVDILKNELFGHAPLNELTWLVLGGDPAARSHRVEQFTATLAVYCLCTLRPACIHWIV